MRWEPGEEGRGGEGRGGEGRGGEGRGGEGRGGEGRGGEGRGGEKKEPTTKNQDGERNTKSNSQTTRLRTFSLNICFPNGYEKVR